MATTMQVACKAFIAPTPRGNPRKNAHACFLVECPKRGDGQDLDGSHLLELLPKCDILIAATTIRSTPVLFFLSSAREMAAALCPFFHCSHNSAFCAAVNQIRGVTMAHLLTS
jgi:hypothetical protein